MKRARLIVVAAMVCLVFIVVSWVPALADSIQLPKTGQTVSDTAGGVLRDDGQLQMGVAWPSPRFRDNGDGTVTDKLTNLVWLKNANCYGIVTFYQALANSNALKNGMCGLSDNSKENDWRLPNRNELSSLVDAGQGNPSIAAGHPFINAGGGQYWTSTSLADHANAWSVYFFEGSVIGAGKSYVSLCMWPVRNILKLSGNCTISVQKSGRGTGDVDSAPSGISCGGDCSESYSCGTVVTLTATPDANSIFSGWSGACSGTGTCVITTGSIGLSANKTVTAVFNKASH